MIKRNQLNSTTVITCTIDFSILPENTSQLQTSSENFVPTSIEKRHSS